MFEEIESLYHYYDPNRPVNIMMAGISYCDKSYLIERADSEIMSFEYIISGGGTLEIDGRIYHPQKNDVYILPLHSRHRYYSDESDPWVKIWIIFDGRLITDMAAGHIPDDLYFVPDCDIRNYMEELLSITRIYNDDYDRITDEATVLLLKIMIHIKNHLNSKTDRLAERIKQLLDQRLEDELHLDQLCHLLNYTKNHIITVFKDQYGMTPYAYYRNKKIEIAKGYLDNTSMSIGEIAERLKFADSRYFSGCFKESVGMTPSEYRKRS